MSDSVHGEGEGRERKMRGRGGIERKREREREREMERVESQGRLSVLRTTRINLAVILPGISFI